MPFVYLTVDQAVEIHQKTIEVSGGGIAGLRDRASLESILTSIQDDGYYQTFEEKVTHLFFSTCKHHCFVDGNKRMAIALSAQMLLMNGYLGSAQSFIPEMENISYYVASSKINKDLLQRIISAHINDESSEELKLEILHAISDDEI